MNNEEPDYYAKNGLSPIGAFQQGLISEEQYKGFLIGNVIKYVIRAGKKDNAIEDLEKAKHYIDFYRELLGDDVEDINISKKPIKYFETFKRVEEEMEDYFTDEEEFDLEIALNNFPDKMMVPILSHFIHHNHLLIRNPEDFAIVVKCCGLINIVEGKNDD